MVMNGGEPKERLGYLNYFHHKDGEKKAAH